MPEVADLYVRLTANTKGFTAGMHGAAAEGEKFTQTAKRGMVGVAAFGVVGAAAMVGIAAKSIDMATKFQASTEKIHTQAGATQGEVLKVRDAIYQMAGQVGFGPEKLSEAFYHVESAGYRAAQATDIVRKASELAKIGQSDLAETTNAVVGVLQSGWVTGANAAGTAVSLLNAIVGAGNMKMQDLVGAMSTGIAAASKTFGVSMQSSGAAIALMTDQGVPAQMAATHLRMAISLMGAPTKAATKYLTDMGISSADAGKRVSATQAMLQKAGVSTTQLANDMRKPDGFLVALTDLKTHMQGAGLSAAEQSAVISRSFGGGKSGAAIMQMYTNLDLLKTKYGQIGEGASKFGGAWNATQQTMQNQIDKTKARVESWLTQMGMKLLPIATKALAGLNKMFDYLGQHRTMLIAIGVAFGSIVAVGLAAAAVAAWSFMAPFLMIAVPIAAVAAGIYLLWEKCATFRTIVLAVGNALKVALVATFQWLSNTALPALRTVWNAVWNAIGAVIQWFINGPLKFIKQELAKFSAFWNAHGQELITIVKAVWSFIVGVIHMEWGFIGPFLKAELSIMLSVFRTVWDLVVNIIKTVWNTIAAYVKTYINIVLDTIGLFADLLTGHWSKLWGDVKKLVSDAINGVVSIIKAFGSGLINTLFQAGKDLINGLINGITSMVGAAVSAVKNTVGSIVNGAKSMLGIKSPSTVFHGIGLNVGQGLANGITASEKHVAAAAKRLAAATKSAHHKALVAHHKVVAGELRTQGHTLTAEALTDSNLSKFVHNKAHHNAAGERMAKFQYARDLASAKAHDAAAHRLRSAIAKDPNATATERASAAAEQARADKMVKSLEALNKSIVTMTTATKAVVAGHVTLTHGRRLGAKQAMAEDLPTYLASMVGAGRAGALLDHRNVTPSGYGTPHKPIIITVPVQVKVGAKVVHQEIQKQTLMHEKRNVNNGTTRYTKR